ncbi:MAG: hypothetical protein ACI9SP_002969 [Arenicella sp.]
MANDLNAIFKIGKDRYQKRIPPGFHDSSKGEKGIDNFSYAGLVYEKKYESNAIRASRKFPNLQYGGISFLCKPAAWYASRFRFY